MFNSLKIDKEFYDDRLLDSIMFKLSSRDKYIINQYQHKMDIENRSSWLLRIIEKEIVSTVEAGFVEIK